jgi:hypothetical protein
MTITIGQVRAITHDLVLNSLTDNVYQSAAGLRHFYNKREKQDGGNDIGSPVIIGGVDSTTGGWYTGASTLNDSEKADITRAKVEWKQVYETVLISNLDILKNNGSSGILKLVAAKVKIAEKRLKSRLATGIFSNGSDALVFDGLEQIIGSGNYAGLASGDILDESGASAWLAYQLTSAGTLTEVMQQRALGEATEDEDRPNVAFMRQNTYNEVWGILAAHQRIIVEDASFSGAGHDQKKVLMYNGIPHYVDSHMKAASIYYVNSEYTKLHVHSMEDMKAQSFKQLEDINAIKERMLLTGNMFSCNRRSNSSIEGITVVA